MKKLNVEVEVLKLKDAIVVMEDENASEESIAAALITIKGLADKLATYKHKLSSRLEVINASKQMQLELIYSNNEGDGIGVITEDVEHISVDMVGVHKDAQANISVTYSDKIYEQLFKPTIRANKKDVIRLADEGLLPNSNQRVRKGTIQQTKLFDYKEPSKD